MNFFVLFPNVFLNDRIDFEIKEEEKCLVLSHGLNTVIPVVAEGKLLLEVNQITLILD